MTVSQPPPAAPACAAAPSRAAPGGDAAVAARKPAYMVLGAAQGANAVVTSTPNDPAFHLGAVHTRALAWAGYEPRVIASERPGRLLREGWSFARQIADGELAVVVQGYGTFAAAMRTALHRRPRVVLHTWKVPGVGSRRLSTRANDAVMARVIRRAALVVLNARWQQRHVDEHYPKTPTVWVPVAEDVDWWRPGEAETELVRSLDLPAGGFLMCVGDVDRDESLPVALAQRLGRPLVRVTRDPRTADRARAAAAAAGMRDSRVLHWVTWPQLRDLYRTAWAVLLAPTTWVHPAGLNGLTEALSCGAPVLFPNTPTAEGYVTSGVEGMLYDELTLDCVAAAARAYEDAAVRQRVSAAARLKAETDLTFDAAATTVAARLRELGLSAQA